ncbi:unnamed protein product [Cylindrotheca closterium]|uniref:Cytochrome b5 heme-binding domain-containing protein n=1 Tax=Cylindrotheca closterium TaxID=2856 RepID=A0AAD2CNE1_9STRA|nr:unnamed protein product [Cylindrotheca closterium]
MNLLWHVAAPLVSLAVFVAQKKNQINNFLMGFFRDIGRIKAKNRRLQKASAMIASTPTNEASNWDILLKRDDPLEGIDLDANDDLLTNGESDPDAPATSSLTTFTLAELSEYGNGQNGNPILLSLFGRVYDVSEGTKFYGEGGKYHIFAGHDITYALSTGCKTLECVDVRRSAQEAEQEEESKHVLEDLTEKQLKEGKRWLSFFHLHDKYNLVGRLEEDRDSWLDALVDSDIKKDKEEDQGEEGVQDEQGVETECGGNEAKENEEVNAEGGEQAIPADSN